MIVLSKLFGPAKREQYNGQTQPAGANPAKQLVRSLAPPRSGLREFFYSAFAGGDDDTLDFAFAVQMMKYSMLMNLLSALLIIIVLGMYLLK